MITINIKDLLQKKNFVIGMIHLKKFSSSYNYPETLKEVFQHAREDLKALEEGGVDAAIVENFHNVPYSTEISRPDLISFAHVFTKLQEIAKIPLGVNIQYTNDTEELEIANICGGDFIRSEAFVEHRVGSFGYLKPHAPKLIKYKNETNSKVLIFADINVKHTSPLVRQPLEYNIKEAINFGADALILTGVETGKSPSIEEAEKFKYIAGGTPVIIGSGVNKTNINDFLDCVDGVIIGTAFKENGDVNSRISVERVKELINSIHS